MKFVLRYFRKIFARLQFLFICETSLMTSIHEDLRALLRPKYLSRRKNRREKFITNKISPYIFQSSDNCSDNCTIFSFFEVPYLATKIGLQNTTGTKIKESREKVFFFI
jgi:hypothetical protein